MNPTSLVWKRRTFFFCLMLMVWDANIAGSEDFKKGLLSCLPDEQKHSPQAAG